MKARKPIRGAVAKQAEKAAAVRKLIANENARHGRKITSLTEQTAAAHRNTSPGSQAVSLARIRGDRADETARHREKLDTLNTRLNKIFR